MRPSLFCLIIALVGRATAGQTPMGGGMTPMVPLDRNNRVPQRIDSEEAKLRYQLSQLDEVLRRLQAVISNSRDSSYLKHDIRGRTIADDYREKLLTAESMALINQTRREVLRKLNEHRWKSATEQANELQTLLSGEVLRYESIRDHWQGLETNAAK